MEVAGSESDDDGRAELGTESPASMQVGTDYLMPTVDERHRAVPLMWTPQLVARFWDQWADRPELHDQYFTFRLGEAIANFLGHVTDLRGRRVLDYGCGPGYLVEHLLRRGASATGADFSAESVRAVNERLSGRANWEGAMLASKAPAAIADASIDIITCIETIEHMFESARESMLAEFWRILKVGGAVMITTPYEENLMRSMVSCPQCEQSFHMMQHLRSWSREELADVLKNAGFDVIFCVGTNLQRWMPQPRKRLIDYSIRDIKALLCDAWRVVADRISPNRFPCGRTFRHLLTATNSVHLVAIAVKEQRTVVR